MKYLILISLSLGIVGCDGYETNYQASIDDKQGGHHEEECNLRDWAIECTRDAYSPDDMMDCVEIVRKRLEAMNIRHGVPPSSRRHPSNEVLAIRAIGRKCADNAQGFYEKKRCLIRAHVNLRRSVCIN